jgi:hypothetical protein
MPFGASILLLASAENDVAAAAADGLGVNLGQSG